MALAVASDGDDAVVVVRPSEHDSHGVAPLGRHLSHGRAYHLAVLENHEHFVVFGDDECAGEGSARISVYDAATGRPVGRGLVGFDASNLSVWTPTAGCEFLLASHDRLTSAFVCC